MSPYFTRSNMHKKAFFHEAIVNLTARDLERHLKVPSEFHGSVDDDEVIMAEKIVMEDPRVQEEIKKLQLPLRATVICDPWIW